MAGVVALICQADSLACLCLCSVSGTADVITLENCSRTQLVPGAGERLGVKGHHLLWAPGVSVCSDAPDTAAYFVPRPVSRYRQPSPPLTLPFLGHVNSLRELPCP